MFWDSFTSEHMIRPTRPSTGAPRHIRTSLSLINDAGVITPHLRPLSRLVFASNLKLDSSVDRIISRLHGVMSASASTLEEIEINASISCSLRQEPINFARLETLKGTTSAISMVLACGLAQFHNRSTPLITEFPDDHLPCFPALCEVAISPGSPFHWPSPTVNQDHASFWDRYDVPLCLLGAIAAINSPPLRRGHGAAWVSTLRLGAMHSSDLSPWLRGHRSWGTTADLSWDELEGILADLHMPDVLSNTMSTRPSPLRGLLNLHRVDFFVPISGASPSLATEQLLQVIDEALLLFPLLQRISIDAGRLHQLPITDRASNGGEVTIVCNDGQGRVFRPASA